MERLLSLRILPIVNENDTVATQEIRFGDNDHLAALVSRLLHADLLVLLSDVDALYTRPPHEPGAEPIRHVRVGDDLAGVKIGDIGSAGVGTGGASTKIAAAKLASQSGTAVLLTSAAQVGGALSGEQVGTWFDPAPRAHTGSLTTVSAH
jgi:glutamate 5-kinase